MLSHYLTVRIPHWLLFGDCPDAAANLLGGPVVFYRVSSEAVASKLLEMFKTNDPKAGFGFLLMHPYSSRMLGERKEFSRPVFGVVDGGGLDLGERTAFQDTLDRLEKAATDNEPPRDSWSALLKEYHLQARKWEVTAAEPRQDGLPGEIGVLLDRGDFPSLSDDEHAKLGAWLTAHARKAYHGLGPENVAKTRRMEEAKKRLRAIFEYNSALRQSAAPGAGPGAVAETGQRAAVGLSSSAGEPRGRKWTQSDVDAEIRKYKAAGGRAARYVELREAVAKGKPGAMKAARKLFGRNVIAEQLGCSSFLVSQSAVWLAIAEDLKIPLRRNLPRGTRRTRRPGRVGHDMAVEELSAAAEAEGLSPSAALEKEEGEDTLRCIRHLAESGHKQQAEALLEKYKRGDMTDKEVRELVEILLQPSD